MNQKSPISKNDWWFAIGIGSGDTGNAEELTRAYGNFCHAAKIRPLASPHITPTTPSAQLQPSLLRHVRHGTLLHNLLSATSGGLFRSIVPILYLNIITWYYQHHYNAAQSNADELAQLRRLMHKARSAKSITALLWVLVTDPDSCRIHHPQAAWLLNRLLRVESRLSIRLQLRLEAILLQFLLTDEIGANESSWLTPEQFRSEVMADLDFEPSEYTLSLRPSHLSHQTPWTAELLVIRHYS